MEPSALRTSSTTANSGSESVVTTVPDSRIVAACPVDVARTAAARPWMERQSMSSYQAKPRPTSTPKSASSHSVRSSRSSMPAAVSSDESRNAPAASPGKAVAVRVVRERSVVTAS